MKTMEDILTEKISNMMYVASERFNNGIYGASSRVAYSLDYVLKKVLSLNDYERLMKEIEEEVW